MAEAEFSVSCVENYFLPWVGTRTDARILYADSFLPAGEVLRDFCEGGAAYASYDKLPRVQDVSERLGYTSHERTEQLPAAIRADELTLIKVNGRFFRDAVRTPWRDDHYICLTDCTRGGFGYRNNYPSGSGRFCAAALREIYGGLTLRYTFCAAADDARARAAAVRSLEDLCGKQPAAYAPQTADPRALRDAVGILKVSRKRLAAWLAYLAERGLCERSVRAEEQLVAQIRTLETFYLRLEMQALRNTRDDRGNAEALDKIYEGDREIWTAIQRRNG